MAAEVAGGGHLAGQGRAVGRRRTGLDQARADRRGLMSRFNPVFAGLPTTIFTVMAGPAGGEGGGDPGRGFPGSGGPEGRGAGGAGAPEHGSNQVPAKEGPGELRQATAEHYRRFHG